jgi:hypothetical protein
MPLLYDRIRESAVAFGVGADPTDDSTIKWVATGFAVARPTGMPAEDPGMIDVRITLVTNRHVVDHEMDLILHLNPRGSSKPARLALKSYRADDDPVWVGHPDPTVDVAVTGAVQGWLNKAELDPLSSIPWPIALDLQEMRQQRVTEGDAVFLIGYPRGIVPSGEVHHPVVRRGGIARIQDTYQQGGRDFLIDAPAFPGNSGGPVILAPRFHQVDPKADPVNPGTALLGIISSGQKYPGKDGVDHFMGLNKVFTVDAIAEAIDEHDRLFAL